MSVRLTVPIVGKAIETEEEHDCMIAAVEHLMDKGEAHQSPEESALLENMAILIQAYEDRHHPLPPARGGFQCHGRSLHLAWLSRATCGILK